MLINLILCVSTTWDNPVGDFCPNWWYVFSDKRGWVEGRLSASAYHMAGGELWYGYGDKPNRLTTLALSIYPYHKPMASMRYGIWDKHSRRG